MPSERIGIIGPGRMGLAMVKHLIKAGYNVTAADIDCAQLKKAEDAGADPAANAAEVGQVSDFVIICVGFDDETIAVTTGARGLLETMAAGSVIAISSTASPDTVRLVAERAGKKGIELLDAPMCRGRWSADEGTLLALVGGKDEVVERARPVYATFCSDFRHLAELGHGQFAKAMNNFLLWVNGIALIEAGRLSEAFGADLVKLREALLISSGKSAALEDWDLMTFTWALKDMQIVSKLTDANGLSLPVMGTIRELVKEARRTKRENPPDWTGEAHLPFKP